ncbi:MAG: hypothetical protein F6K47_36005 [Symploca sp. SIO2E6]|nr:hypothetical protein [Symploca sp. SIO2E6]
MASRYLEGSAFTPVSGELDLGNLRYLPSPIWLFSCHLLRIKVRTLPYRLLNRSSPSLSISTYFGETNRTSFEMCSVEVQQQLLCQILSRNTLPMS